MPNWLIVSLIVFLVAPGAVIILFGVYAMFRAPEPQAPTAHPEPTTGTDAAPTTMSFSSSPVPPLTIDSVTETADGEMLAADPVIDTDIEILPADPLLPAPGPDDNDVT